MDLEQNNLKLLKALAQKPGFPVTSRMIHGAQYELQDARITSLAVKLVAAPVVREWLVSVTVLAAPPVWPR